MSDLNIENKKEKLFTCYLVRLVGYKPATKALYNVYFYNF